jgi:hypothetical protein
MLWDDGKPISWLDHPADVMKETLFKLPGYGVDDLINMMNPLEQYKSIKTIADPAGLFQT